MMKLFLFCLAIFHPPGNFDFHIELWEMFNNKTWIVFFSGKSTETTL